ncbi:tellurium resistance protein [Thiorhodococcus mannitoliphagus]|uniref:Tellurium resistance protein n=1 Tax=Thiorhodococcus mannitoliphagus TaxID=329406 RepID=A0A6P1DRY6_9GAMM|nr:TerD family protein [Thiorhodococcus mannitoliphagus]NEX21037.1 tellurium resistance protein [Thiorhodococcus mannitoliphagus]
MDLTRGQRAKIADLVPGGQQFTLGVTAEAPGLVIDFACFGLDAQGKLADERYMTFFNQPTTPCGGVRLETPPGDTAGFAIDLSKLPATIERLTVTAALENAGTMSQIQRGHVRFLGPGGEVGRFAFTGADFASERALMLLEIYRKDGIWRTCALGQGFNGGLDALVKHFGGTVAEPTPAPSAPEPPKPQAPPVNLSKITLEKKGNTVSLKKQGNQDHGEILINLNWDMRAAPVKRGFFGGTRSGGIDLDVGCLFELKDGTKSVVQALGNSFGNFWGPPYIMLDADDRTGTRTEGENLRINGKHWDEIRRVLVFAFIYEGTPNWAETNAVISLKMPGQPEIEVRLDSGDNRHPMCAIALLENDGGAVRVTKLVDYYRAHPDVDKAYHWGLQWVRGSK